MNPCTECLYYRICFERRGICTEYKTLEMIRNEIRMLNENQAPPAVRTVPADKGGVQEAGDRGGKVYQSLAERLQAKARTDPEAQTEAQVIPEAAENTRHGKAGSP